MRYINNVHIQYINNAYIQLLWAINELIAVGISRRDYKSEVGKN
jgi:hypothetical protein